ILQLQPDCLDGGAGDDALEAEGFHLRLHREPRLPTLATHLLPTCVMAERSWQPSAASFFTASCTFAWLRAETMKCVPASNTCAGASSSGTGTARRWLRRSRACSSCTRRPTRTASVTAKRSWARLCLSRRERSCLKSDA